MASVCTHSKLFKQRSFYTQQASSQRSFTQQAFTHSKLLHREAFTHSKLSHTASVYTQNTYTQCFYTWQAFTHTASFLNREAFTHNKLLHREAFTHSKLSHTASVYTQNTYAQCFYTWQAFTHTETFTQRRFYTQRSFYTQQAFTEKVFAQRSFLVHNHNRNCSSKTGSRRQSAKKTILKHFLKGILKGKLLAPKLRKSADKSLSQPWCSHSNTIYDLQLQKTITHAAAAPSNLDAATTMRSAETELQNTIELGARASEIAAPKRISTPKRQKDDFEVLFKRNFKRTIISAKIEKICWQITFAALMQPFQYDLRSSAAKDYYACSRCTKQPWRSHYNAICRDWVAKHNRTTCNGVGNCSSKTGSRRQSDKKTILKHFLKGILKGKLLAPKLRKSADKSLSQPWCSHSNTIYDLQLQKTIVLRMQPQHRATLTQPLQCVSQHPVANLHLSTDVATPNDNNHAAIPMRSATTASRNA